MILPGSYANGFAPRDGQPLYPELWRGCVGAWNPGLGPTGLTLRDWSGRGNHGTLTNVTAGTVWAPSQGQWGLTLDGTNDFVDMGKTINQIMGTVTRGAYTWWVRPTGTGNQSWWGRATNDLGAGANLGAQIFSGVIYVGWFLGSGGETRATVAVSASTVVANQWQCYTVNWTENGETTLFRNGIQIATIGSTPVYSTSRTHTIGYKIFGSSTYFSGDIGDHFIYNNPLPESQIRLLATRRGIAYELAPRRRSRVAVITSGFSALRPSILRGSR
jgi:hypothetical protein